MVNNFRASDKVIDISKRRRKSKVNKIVKGVTIVGITAGSIIGGAYGVNKLLNNISNTDGGYIGEDVDKDNNDIYSIDISTDSLSSLNVVLVNDGISDEQMEEVSDSLESKGLDVEVKDMSGLVVEGNECFVALTNYNGDKCKVDANYKSGNNHADLLAIGMKTAFGGDIQRGVYDTSVATPTLVPSNIENAAGDRLMPNVTIAVPYDYNMSDSYDTVVVSTPFVDDFLEGLARYSDSLNYVDIYEGPFLLRPDILDKDSSDYKDSIDEGVLKVNDLDSRHDVKEDSVLLNKGLPSSFDKGIEINIEEVNIKNNSL